MKRIGICQKCGKETIVRDHHIIGYLGENKDIIAPYCFSCDRKAHNKAKKSGKCNLTEKETYRLSSNSSQRRYRKTFSLSHKTLEPNVLLRERLSININTNTININSCFEGTAGKKLKIIEEI
ncbi:MAG: hypothetical protein WA130_02170 [Candidatus Methanoperedens sp.]